MLVEGTKQPSHARKNPGSSILIPGLDAAWNAEKNVHF